MPDGSRRYLTPEERDEMARNHGGLMVQIGCAPEDVKIADVHPTPEQL
jgi:hypothetical protein